MQRYNITGPLQETLDENIPPSIGSVARHPALYVVERVRDTSDTLKAHKHSPEITSKPWLDNRVFDIVNPGLPPGFVLVLGSVFSTM